MDVRDERKRTFDEASKQNFGWHQNQGVVTALGSAWRGPTYGPCGVRCTGGVTQIRAFVRNSRTWLAMEGKRHKRKTREAESTDAQSGADCLVVVMKRGNARGAKGAGHSRRDHWSTGNRRNRLVVAEGGSLQWVARAV